MNCYICKDETENGYLHKICICEDSLLCKDCLILSNTNINNPLNTSDNKYKCCVCRRDLKFIFTNGKEYYKNIFFFYLIKSISLLCDVYPIIYIYCVAKDYDIQNSILYISPDYFLINCMIHTLVIKFIIKEKILTFYHNQNENIKIEKIINIDYFYIIAINILFVLFIIIFNVNLYDFYTLLILIPFYYIPFLSIVLSSSILILARNLTYFKRTYGNKKLFVRGLIYNNYNTNNI